MRQKVILDVDPGIDDAIAIITALQVKDIEVLGISTVNGNVGSKFGALNTLKILDVVGKTDIIPVIQGASRPIVNRPLQPWLRKRLEEIHGKGGLGGIGFETVKRKPATKMTFADFINSIAKNYGKNEISIIATGPLTNVAKALVNNRFFAESISEICIMGGAYGLASDVFGNVTPYAEFNFYSDPEAAKIVLQSNIDLNIKVIGLDVTQKPKCAVDAKVLEILNSKKNKNRTAGFIASLLRFVLLKNKFFYLHDVFAVAMFEKPSLFRFKKGNIDITLRGKMRGHSSFHESNISGNLLVAADVNEDGFNDFSQLFK